MITTTADTEIAFDDKDCLGKVRSVDTATVTLSVDDLETLQRLQVNRLVAIRMSAVGHYLIGMVDRIRRTVADDADPDDDQEPVEANIVRVILIGTFKTLSKDGRRNVFVRSLEQVASIADPAFALEGARLTTFMQSISRDASKDAPLELGVYTLDDAAKAFLDGNRFFQRHAVIVGSTGSGKSYTTARLLEQIAALPNGNALVFDVHGEYEELGADDGIAIYRIAGPGDVQARLGLDDRVIHLPYWLLRYEALQALLMERSDSNAPTQAAFLSETIYRAKRDLLETASELELLEQFTLDSPVPFDLPSVIDELSKKDVEMVPGARGEKQGDYFGKFARLIGRMKTRTDDKRFGFLFGAPEATMNLDWLARLGSILATNAPAAGATERSRVRIVDVSEVPSDVLPLVVALLAEIVFRLKQWGRLREDPISLVCDEAHLYVPETGGSMDALSTLSLGTFERIAKEGRKYGVGLVIVTQRPSEVNRTVLSQSNNYIAMRLLNADDRSVIRALLPDSLGGFSDLLQSLDVGEALVVGDASLLPSRVRITPPNRKPNSKTRDFWTDWSGAAPATDVAAAVEAWRKQSIAR